MGVPVLTTNNGSLMEIIENNKNGYLSENLIDSNVNNFVNNLFNNVTKYEEIHLSCIEKSKKYIARNVEINETGKATRGTINDLKLPKKE